MSLVVGWLEDYQAKLEEGIKVRNMYIEQLRIELIDELKLRNYHMHELLEVKETLKNL